MKDKEIYLLRHGDTGFAGQYIGSSDVPLSEKGIIEVKKSCKILSNIDFDIVLCSPMERCRQTALHLDLSSSIQFLDFLKEIDFGRWEQKTFQEIVESDQASVDTWVENPDTFSFPDGESLIDFHKRILAVTDFLYASSARRILMICHGGIIRHLLCSLLQVPKEQYLLFEIQPATYSTVQLYREGGVLTGLNLQG